MCVVFIVCCFVALGVVVCWCVVFGVDLMCFASVCFVVLLRFRCVGMVLIVCCFAVVLWCVVVSCCVMLFCLLWHVWFVVVVLCCCCDCCDCCG